MTTLTTQLARRRAYSGQLRGVAASAREAVGLYRLHAHAVPERVAAELDRLRSLQRGVEDELGEELAGRDVLDVGAGQLLLHAAYFAQRNAVTAVDLEVIAQGVDPRPYARMLAANGLQRTIKTIARKGLRIDRAYRRELTRQLGLRRFPAVRALPMDATDLSFPDRSFDFVFCHSVVHHLERPDVAVDEAVRVLRPDGIGFFSLHLWTSDTGSLDPRVMRGDAELPLWPHLRPEHRASVLQNAWVNRLRLREWRDLFEQRMPGCRLRLDTDELAHLAPAARGLQDAGELGGYELEELLTRSVQVLWRKAG